MRWRFIALFLLFFISIFVTKTASAATYNVTPSTIGSTLGNLQPGDIINMAPGTYSPMVISKSGTATAPIVVTGDHAIVSGGTKTVDVTGSYLNISGLEVTGAYDHGLHITGKHIKLTNFSIHDNVTHNRKSDGTCGAQGSSGWGSGLSIKVGSEDIQVENGAIYNNCGEGLAATRTNTTTVKKVTSYDNYSANFYIDNSMNVTLNGNFSYCNNTQFYRDNHPATGLLMGEEYYSGWGAHLENATVINNINYNCQGIKFYGSQVSGGLKGALVAHNTIWKIWNGGSAVYIASASQNTNIVIKNNIAPGYVSTGTNITTGNNITTATFQNTPSFDPNSFKLSAGSAGIDAGAILGIAMDYYGSSRDTKPDVGAYEYTSGFGSVTTPTPTTSATTPTPTPAPSPTPMIKLGDANNDNLVNETDFSIWKTNYTKTISGGATVGDFNNDGKINGVDYAIWLTHYGT